MDKEKFQIPMPDDSIIQVEIEQIIAKGMKRKQSFPSYLMNLSKQIGLRTLLPSSWEEIGIITAVLALLLYLSSNTSTVQDQDLYALTFLLSPFLYLALSIYHFAKRMYTNTYEVEMVCKYTVYQIATFRMLVFSVCTIIINSVSIMALALQHSQLEPMRAWMISMTSLFLFSIVFLFLLMKKQSAFMAALVIAGWISVNLIVKIVAKPVYESFLIMMPLAVHMFIFIISVAIYLYYVKKLVNFKPAEGV